MKAFLASLLAASALAHANELGVYKLIEATSTMKSATNFKGTETDYTYADQLMTLYTSAHERGLPEEFLCFDVSIPNFDTWVDA